MKSFLFLILAIILTFSPALVQPAQAALLPDQTTQTQGECPDWLTIPGECLSEEGLIQVETGEAGLVGHSMLINTRWQPDRWLIQVGITVPTPPVLPGGFNLNRYRLELDSVFVDQRQFAFPPENEGQFGDSVYVFVKLVCDWQGSTQPTLTASMPAQYITLANGFNYHRIPRSTMLDVINWEIRNEPCKYW